MSIYVGVARVLVTSLVIYPSAVLAGAWTLDAGQGQAIVYAAPSESTRAFDQSGKLAPYPRYSKDDAGTLIEYGALDALTVLMAPSLQHVSVEAPYGGQRTGLGYTEGGARVRLWTDGSWVLSEQTTFRMPGTFDKQSSAAIGYYDPQVDIRGLVGYGFKLGSLPAFINVEMAQRLRFGGPPNEYRADFTFGVKPYDRWLVLLQSFNVISEGAGTWGIPRYAYYKFQLSGVYALTPKVSLQLGGFTTYAGHNALQENGLVLGLWCKF